MEVASLKLKDADMLERLFIFFIHFINLNLCFSGLCVGQNPHGKVSQTGMNLCSASKLILNLVKTRRATKTSLCDLEKREYNYLLLLSQARL